MNYISKAIIISVLLLTLNACLFLPKSETPIPDNNNSCTTTSKAWSVEVIPLVTADSNCHSEICGLIFIGVPLVTAAFTIPIVAIGNTINFVERKFSCD